ncbi:alkaline phosphatase family protein [Haliangium sp.]|uniref:alkaline phosphatase family protein n=1 Tax=Haliangium sp. TaxID=2663208 RepID=UPI003D125DA3
MRPGPRAGSLAIAAIAASLLLLGGCGGGDDGAEIRASWPATDKRLVVLGVDGMDPELLDQYMREGRMPNLKKLAETGSYKRLGTTFPPQSPVAWSTFITGMDAGGHGIYDFVHRDPHLLGPYLSTSRPRPAETWHLGSWEIPNPFSNPEMELLRAGRAFWQDLEEHQVRATVMKVPANFPPADSRANESMAGMGTPDILGTYGTFQLYTDDPVLAQRRMSGGIVHAVDFGAGHRAEAVLDGMPDGDGEALTVPIVIARDPEREAALVRVGDHAEVLTPGEWSDWIAVDFNDSLTAPALPGMVRLYLARVRPHLVLYASPTNIDPTDPIMPISAPAAYAEEVAADVGRYYTQGMPEDTKALAAGALSDDEFLHQAELVWAERMRLLDRELERFIDGDGGVLFFYFSSIDQVSHVFWRTLDLTLRPEHAAEDGKHPEVIPELYARVDGVIGDVIERVGPGTDVIVMSDHGFSPYRYKVHLNTWLAQQGFLSLLPPDKVQPGPLGHIDWDNTQAYALGLNQVFINLAGREAHGAVPAEDYEVLVQNLARQLEGFRDPDTGAYVVTKAVRPGPTAFEERAPDLLVGYARGYRSSDESAVGQVGELLIEPNRDKWSGDHCMHPSHVPGVLLTNRKVTHEAPSLLDLAPTILSYFGVTPGPELTGTPLWAP